MGKKQGNKKKEKQAQRDQLTAKLKKQQTAAAAAISASHSSDETEEADDDGGQQLHQQRLCAHMRALSSARYKSLSADVQAWLSKQATAAANSPILLCLECGYMGPQPESKEEAKEADMQLEEDAETKEQLTTAPTAALSTASHFHATHFVGLRLSSAPTLTDCACYRCNVTLADALSQSPEHVKLLKLAAFITALASSTTTSPSSSSSSPTAATPFIFTASASASSASVLSSNLSTLSVSSSMRGLVNAGNTCFFNSVIQCLAASRPLLAALFPPPATSTPQPLQHQLSLFLTNMNAPLSSLSSLSSHKRVHGKPFSLSSSSASSYSPGALLSAVQAINPQFKGGRQHDAHELLRCILSALVTEGEEKEKRKRREQLVATISQWTAADVKKVLASAGMARGLEGQVMKRLEEIAAKERGCSESSSSVVDGAVVIMLLEKWEMKEGKRWRKAMSEGVDDEDKKRLERCFTSLRQGKLPSLTTDVNSTAADGDAQEGEEAAEESSKGSRSVSPPADSVVHRVFAGVMEQCVTCLSCGAASWTEEVYFDLSLPIEPPRPIEVRKPEDRRATAADRVSVAIKPKVAVREKVNRESEEERRAKEEAAKERERVKQEQRLKETAEKEETERRYLLRLEEAQREEVTLPSVVRRKKQQPAQFARKGKKMSQAEKRRIKEKERRKSGRLDTDKAADEEKEEQRLEEAEEQREDDDEHDGAEEERKEAHSEGDSEKVEKVVAAEVEEQQAEQNEELKEQRVEQVVQEAFEVQPSIAESIDDTVQQTDESKEERTVQPTMDVGSVMVEHKELSSERAVIDLTGDSEDDDDTQLSHIINDLSIAAASSQPSHHTETEAASTTSSSALVSSFTPSPPLPTSRLLSGACTILDCLQSFFDPELLSGSNQFTCSSCSSLASLSFSSTASSTSSAPIVCKRDATRRCYLRLLPSVLTVHLKRFSASASGRTMEKLSKPVSFPVQLNLAAFTRSPSTGAAAAAAGEAAAGDGGYMYGLYGVVCHSGGMGGGHYVCYVRRGRGGWWYASDSAVREASEGEVLKAQAYILFYERLLDDNAQQR